MSLKHLFLLILLAGCEAVPADSTSPEEASTSDGGTVTSGATPQGNTNTGNQDPAGVDGDTGSDDTGSTDEGTDDTGSDETGSDDIASGDMGSDDATTTDGEGDDEEDDEVIPVPVPSITLSPEFLGGLARITIDLPDDASHYGTLTIRRAIGSRPPADCDSGTVAATYNDFSTDPIQMRDATGVLDTQVSYRVCVTNTDDTFQDSTAAGPITTGYGQRIFMTSTTHTGNLDRIAGAHAICQARADAASLSGTWKAVLATAGAGSPPRPTSILETYNIIGEAVGNIFDGEDSLASLAYDENGDAVTGTAWVGPSGGAIDCFGWTYGFSSMYALVGDPISKTPFGDSIIARCNTDQRLYCLRAPDIEVPALRVETGTTSGSLDVSVTLPASVDGYGKLELQRVAGIVPPADDCFGQDSTKVAEWTSFTAGASLTLTDSGTPGERYSYRLCVFDSLGRLSDRPVAIGVRAFGAGTYARIFVSTNTRKGNDGLAAFDADCASEASAAGLGSNFVALMSHSDYPGLSRFNILQDVESLNGQLVSRSTNHFSRLPARFDLTAAGGDPGDIIFTGLSSSLGHASNCQDWSSQDANEYTPVGRSTETSILWSSGTVRLCSAGTNFYCLEQPTNGLAKFAARQGTHQGDVDLEIVLPSDVSSYASLKAVRIPEEHFSDAGCASGTVVYASSGPFTADQIILHTDATGDPNGVFAYRACAYDATSVRIATVTQPIVRPRSVRHIVFTTSGTWNGALGGLEGADDKCQAAADAVTRAGTFKAVLSDGSISARDRIALSGTIFNTAGEMVAETPDQFWHSMHNFKMSFDEEGTEMDSPLIHAISTAGEALDSCNNFTSADSSSYYVSRLSHQLGFTGTRYASPCTQSTHLLCISE